MEIDLKKIKKLPPDIKRDFMKMYLRLDEKKKILKIKEDFLTFAKHIWPEFIFLIDFNYQFLIILNLM